MPHGLHQKFLHDVPKATPDEILERETSPYWFWYAEELRDYLEALQAVIVIPWVDKKNKLKAMTSA